IPHPSGWGAISTPRSPYLEAELAWVHDLLGVEDLLDLLQEGHIAAVGPVEGNLGYIAVGPVEEGPRFEDGLGKVLVGLSRPGHLAGVVGVVEEVELQVAGPGVLDGLEVAPQVGGGVVVPGHYIYRLLDELPGVGGLGHEEEVLTSPTVALLPVGHTGGPGLA